jgi:hypothetical protein
MFREERDRFALIFPSVADVRLVFITEHFDGSKARERDVAWFDLRDGDIYIVRRSLSRSLGCLRGVIRHELGHAADPDIEKAGCERRADRIAELVTGVPIRYTKEGIQHATHGEPYRPDWLHQ